MQNKIVKVNIKCVQLSEAVSAQQFVNIAFFTGAEDLIMQCCHFQCVIGTDTGAQKRSVTDLMNGRVEIV